MDFLLFMIGFHALFGLCKMLSETEVAKPIDTVSTQPSGIPYYCYGVFVKRMEV